MRYPASSSNPWLNSIDLWKKVERTLEEQTHDGFQMEIGHNPREPMRSLYDVAFEDQFSQLPSSGGEDARLSGRMGADAARQMGVPDYLTEFDALVLPANKRPDRMYMAEITRETDYADRLAPRDVEKLRQGKVVVEHRPPGFETGLKTVAYVPNDRRMGISDDLLPDFD